MTTTAPNWRVRGADGRYRPLRWWERLAIKLLTRVVGRG